jgi:RES domain-containing protein
LMPTIYARTNPDTLNAEAYHKGRRYGWTQADFNAQLRIGMHWELQRVVDLTVPATLRALRVSRNDILTCDWVAEQTAGREALTQAIARAAFEHLAEGLAVPSARHRGGINIVYYPTHRQSGTVIQVLNLAGLPPDMHGLDP